jgi:hypothetical protein
MIVTIRLCWLFRQTCQTTNATRTPDLPLAITQQMKRKAFRGFSTRGMVRPRSRVSYALRQLKSPLSNISSLGLASLKSTGTFVILGVTQRQVIDVHLGLVPWTTNTTPGGFDQQRFQKGAKGGVGCWF